MPDEKKLTPDQELELLRNTVREREIADIVTNQPQFNHWIMGEMLKLKQGMNTIIDALEDLIDLQNLKKETVKEEPKEIKPIGYKRV